MSKFYDQAPKEVRARVDALFAKHYPQFKTIGLRIDLLVAKFDDEDEDGSAIKLHGYPCKAVVRITSAKERAAGRGDAEITIDEKIYEGMTEEERDALLDHEIYHLQLKTVSGIPQQDAHNRPVLKMRLHDHEFGWFDEIAKRHGEHSSEVQQANAFRSKAGQQCFGWDLPGKVSKAKSTA